MNLLLLLSALFGALTGQSVGSTPAPVAASRSAVVVAAVAERVTAAAGGVASLSVVLPDARVRPIVLLPQHFAGVPLHASRRRE